MILISPSEPRELAEALVATSSPLCEEKGADVLVPTGKGLLGIQRKEIPSDFIASLEDGRLCRELPLLSRSVDFPILLREGDFTYDTDDRLRINGHATRYTRLGIERLFRSAFYTYNIRTEYSESLSKTAEVINELADYFNHEHFSLLTRPKLQGLWGKPIPNEQICYFYQGLPGVGVVLAQSLARIFPQPKDLLIVSLDDLKALPQIGKQRAKRIYTFINEGALK